MTSCVVNSSSRKITISNGFSADISGGTSISIILGPITNPSDQSNTDSLTMISYTDSSLSYSID
jgi:hypothetical protein